MNGESGLQASAISVSFNIVLAVFKISVGIVGNSYALVADGIESTVDIISSLIVYSGLRIAAMPADANHPYGHGKAESIAAVIVALFLLGAAVLIAVQSSIEIFGSHNLPPAWYTLPALLGVVAVKESMFRFMKKTGDSLDSNALRGDAWHHRSDAITSLAAAIGISIALIGGKAYASADDWAALVACLVIVYNGLTLLKPALDEIMDAAAPEHIEEKLIELACSVAGVVEVEKCMVRKSGTDLVMDMHIEVDGNISVREGHDIAHAVRDHILRKLDRRVFASIHVEPAGEDGEKRDKESSNY